MSVKPPEFDDLKGSPLHDQLTGKGLKIETFAVGDLPPKERRRIEPEGGWKERTYYVVEVASGSCNPIHRAILYVGFLNGRRDYPLGGGYTCLFNATYEGLEVPESMHYIKYISEIRDMARGI